MSWAIWITGLPGSGKSALARATAEELRADGNAVVVLELDEIRKVITPSPTYSNIERDVVYRALIFMAGALAGLGTPVIIDATAHRRDWRDLARRQIARFAEVQLVCPLELCREREQQRTTSHAPRGIYARAGTSGALVPGVDVPYEPARAPELTIDTSLENASAAARSVVTLARRLAKPARRAPTSASPAWAIWITGLPGSGKTTLAWSAAEALAARSVPVRILDLAAVRAALLDRGPESDATREILHRTLAYTAKLLTDAGVAVMVDATAPRRAWRQLARDLITHFAEVQLVCPYETCMERERATRWGLGTPRSAAQSSRPATDVPDIVLDYEQPLCPELTLHTNVQGLQGALDELLRLAFRLHRAVTVEAYDLSNWTPSTTH
jgi:adenylylsulfate kinase